MTTHKMHLLSAFALAAALTPSLLLAADLPSTLTGTLINSPDQTLTFGTPSAPATTLFANNSALINNGTWNAYAGTIPPNYSYIGPTFASSITNTGTLTIDANTGTFALLDFTTNQPSSRSPDPRPVTFTNTGTINLNTGKFYLTASDTGSTSGTFNLAANTTLGLAGNLTFDSNSTLTGSGNVLLSTDIRKPTSDPFAPYIPNTTNTPPTITFNGAYNVTGTTTIYGADVTFNHDVTFSNLQVSSPDSNRTGGNNYPGALAGAATITLTGSGTTTSTYTWTGGPSIQGGNITFSSTGVPTGTTLSVPALLINGTLNLSATLVDGTAITIAPGARMAFGGGYFTNQATLTNNGLLTTSGTLSYVHALTPIPDITLTNNNMIYVSKSLVMGQNTQFNNNGTVFIAGGSFQVSAGTESADSVITNHAGRLILWSRRPFLHGTLNNAASLIVFSGGTSTLGPDLTFTNTGSLTVTTSAHLLLQAPQQAATTGTFEVQGQTGVPPGILEFAADYDFSSLKGPTLLHSIYDDGLLLIDPGVTLTLPLDTAFSGTIQVLGTLIIAAPLNPANLNVTPNFTLLPAPVPEPASLALLTCAAPLLLRKRRSISPQNRQP
jgi:hypothetical protein